MSQAIALTNKEGKHTGFVLIAGVVEDYQERQGEWSGDCVFMALPTEAAMFSDPACLELADRKEQGEHSLRVVNDSSTVSLRAADENGDCFYVTIGREGPGEWGTIRGDVRTHLGRAMYAK